MRGLVVHDEIAHAYVVSISALLRYIGVLPVL